MIRTVAGRHNPSLKLAKKLQKKKYRTERGFFLAEGWDVLASALEAGARPAELLVREDLVSRLPEELKRAAERDELDLVICPAEVLADASLLGGAADVLAIFRERVGRLNDWPILDTLSIYLHGVGDPGNVGTLVRGAAAFGAAGVACSPGTADPFGPRSLRAGMGGQFLVPIAVEVTAEQLLAHAVARGAEAASDPAGHRSPLFVVADSRAGLESWEIAETVRERRGSAGTAGIVLVLGSERGALPDLGSDILHVRIPHVRFDSLNVAMAGSILLYELNRPAVCTRQGPRL